MTIEAKGPNAEQITHWNETFGHRWVELQEMLDAQIGPLGSTAQERARISMSERVLDVGCGCGQSSLQIAERVGTSGHVLGIDISEPMLARAIERASGLEQASFENADAQLHEFKASDFDLVYSRFGVMFFADPPAAFANFRRALKPGGRLAFVCWQAAPRNQWILVPMLAIAKHVPLPPPPEPGTPGPMSLADTDRTRGILETAGFEDVAFEDLTGELSIRGRCKLGRHDGLPDAHGTRFRRARRRHRAAAAGGSCRRARGARAVCVRRGHHDDRIVLDRHSTQPEVGPPGEIVSSFSVPTADPAVPET